MSTSETDSEPEPEPSADTVSSLTAFAHLSATPLTQTPTDQEPVSWAVSTLATLDFRLVRKDTTLHNIVQNCASTILALFDSVLQHDPAVDRAYNFIPDVVRILRPSFLHLLFQYRRLFRIIAARNLSSAPPATICWVDVLLAKLGDVVAFVAAGLDGNYPDQSLPRSLKVQKEEDNLRAAIQLPDNWDMLPSMLLSERVSVAAKRLSIKLMLGRYILCPVLSGQVSADNAVHKLLSTFAEFVRQSAARVDGLRSVLEPGLRYLELQERLTCAMAISLFAAADIAQVSTVSPEDSTPFRPQTLAATMRLLRFVLNEEGYLTHANLLDPLNHLDAPTSVIIRWGTVPQWIWSIWLEHRSLYADTIRRLTMVYIHHHQGSPGGLSEIANSVSCSQAVISLMVDLVFQFISALSAGGNSRQPSTGMMGVLHGSCRLISQWMSQNLCEIQNSEECCKALIVLFGYLSQNEQHIAINELLIECLSLMRPQCARDAWRAAAEDDDLGFVEALGRSFIQTKTVLSRDDLPEIGEIAAAQLMQFLVVMMSKGIQPPDSNAFVEFMEAIWEQVLDIPLNGRGLFCETFLLCLATASLFEVDLPFRKADVTAKDEAAWRLGMCGGGTNLFLASAFSLYITSAPVRVELLTYLEGFEHLVDVALQICSGHRSREDGPLALTVLPMVYDAVVHLLECGDDATGIYTRGSVRLSTLENVLRSMGGSEKGEGYELVWCRSEGISRPMYVRGV